MEKAEIEGIILEKKFFRLQKKKKSRLKMMTLAMK